MTSPPNVSFELIELRRLDPLSVEEPFDLFLDICVTGALRFEQRRREQASHLLRARSGSACSRAIT